ncbi:hypothetical protein [Pontibacillus marinus]|uniref:Uncharacterized protein n=1 Tax=Pontibacillus marinus BH030004 = DSM 16465 TaxID=1385511 RepID=A0A0A5GAT1_9BACI|nr:hypothetical protein [Pontibacillus marinus]KGX90281.1 hypothetical protein N783_21055 [Pontibacillus marinus BH030004 = DSM 16465]
MKLFSTKDGKVYGVIFILAILLYMVLQLMNVGNPSVKEEEKRELYNRFTNLIEDVFETNERELYDEYVSSTINKENYLTLWDTYFDHLDRYELLEIPSYEEQDKDFSIQKEKVDIYNTQFQTVILVDEKRVEVPFEVKWGRENKTWKVFEIKMPRDIQDPGLLKRVFRGD